MPKVSFLQSTRTLLCTRWYWLALALVGVGMLGVALYYQYGLGEEPCQICIHARIWVAAWTVLALVMCCLPGRRTLNAAANLLVIACAVGLGERSWYLYKIENGIGNGSCEFFLGFPDWFALDRWLPALFEVRNLCSYSPEMLFGISMAESLLLAAAGIALVGAAALYANLRVIPGA